MFNAQEPPAMSASLVPANTQDCQVEVQLTQQMTSVGQHRRIRCGHLGRSRFSSGGHRRGLGGCGGCTTVR